MTPDALSDRLVELLVQVAPNVERTTLRRDTEFRDQFDFDSMDQLNFAVAIHEALGVDVPERDYRRLASIDGAVRYLLPRLPAQSLPEAEGGGPCG